MRRLRAATTALSQQLQLLYGATTSLSICSCLPHPGPNRLPRPKGNTGCGAWKITPIERMVPQMVQDNPPSPTLHLPCSALDVSPHFPCFISQDVEAEKEVRTLVNRMPEVEGSLAPFQPAKRLMGTWWTNRGSKRTALCSGCLPCWVPS